MKLGKLLADMVLYGDIDEAPWPVCWVEEERAEGPFSEEVRTRANIAASILKLMDRSPGGSWSMHDGAVRPFLNQEVFESLPALDCLNEPKHVAKGEIE